jgi:peptidoglycan/LPS O-acetylase OafA/YrhL
MSAVANPSQTLYKSTEVKSKYRPEIDGLRAFAVVAVIINHFNKDLLPSGYLGVDIFFVISGYVITSSLAGRQSKNFLDFLTGFYERRIKRLVPALVVFVLVTSILTCLFNPEPRGVLGAGWRSLFGFSNIYLYTFSTDYFAESTELNSFTHTWSLGVEEQFYLLFPFLIWFSGFGQQKKKGARNLFLWIGALTIVSLSSFIYLYQVNQPAAYFLMPPRFWEMAAGCLLFIGFQKRARIEKVLDQVPPLLIVAAMVGVMFLPVSTAVPATIGVVVLSAVLIACLKRGTLVYKFFTLEKVVFVGLISYSLYLWHWTVLSISRWTIGIHWWSVPPQILLMLLIAIGSYQFVESPIRRNNILIHSKWKTISLGAGILVMQSAAVVFMTKISSNIYLGISRNPEIIFSENSHWDHKLCQNGHIYEFVPTTTILEQCWVGNENSIRVPIPPKVQIFSYGDSYNEQLVGAYYQIAKKKPGTAFHAFYSSGCTSSEHLSFSEERIRGHCAEVFHKYMQFFQRESRSGDTLIIAASPAYFYILPKPKYKFFMNGKPIDVGSAVVVYTQELRQIAKKLKSRRINLLVTSGIPVLQHNPDVCIQWYAQSNSKCVRSEIYDSIQTSEVVRINATLSSGIKDVVSWVNLFDRLVKPMSSLSAYQYYYNYNHLSRDGAFKVKDLIEFAINNPKSE